LRWLTAIRHIAVLAGDAADELRPDRSRGISG
jgi:hypothetical protein